MTTSEVIQQSYSPDPSSGTDKLMVPSKREAPELLVSYRCPRTSCSKTAVLNAYLGVPSCHNNHVITFMEPMFIVKGAQ